MGIVACIQNSLMTELLISEVHCNGHFDCTCNVSFDFLPAAKTAGLFVLGVLIVLL